MAAQPAVPQLVEALGSNDPALRWRAARALGSIGDRRAVEALRNTAADQEGLVRAQSIFALGRLGVTDEDSLAVIVAHLTDKDVQVRRASVRALRMIQAPRATVIPLVVKLLEDSDPAIAMRALGTIAEGGVEVVPVLTAALEHKEARYWASLALAEIGPQAKDAVPGLVKVLTDERPEVRLQAVIALGEIGPEAKPAVGSLAKALQDPFEAVQTAAIFALGRIGDPAAEEPLVRLESSTDPFQKMLATWALARLYPDDKERLNAALAALVKGLGSEERDLSQMAARALSELEADPKVVRPMVEAMVGDDPALADRVLSAFASLGARAVPHAIEALQDPERRVRALQVLGRIGPEAAPAVPALTELLKSEDANTRTEALYVLASIGPGAKAAVGPISENLAVSDPKVQQVAAYALGKIGADARESAAALRKLVASEDELVRLTAIWALLQIGPRTDDLVKAALPVLTDALKHKRDFVRIEAAMALGDLGKSATDALPALQTALRDPSAGVRSAAAAAIEKIKG
jgi:HEAT repeat protein